MGILDIFKFPKIKHEYEYLKRTLPELEEKLKESEAKNEQLKRDFNERLEESEKKYTILQEKADAIGVAEYYQTKEKIDEMIQSSNEDLASIQKEISSGHSTVEELNNKTLSLEEKNSKLQKQISAQTKKLARTKELYKSVDHAINNFFVSEAEYENCRLHTRDFEELELISPSVILKLHCMDVKDLRKAYKENEKQIDSILKKYSARYTTKANKSIYTLMVIALRAELQNVLHNLKYEKLDKSVEDIKTISAKYLEIAGEGNQNIAGTLTKFIGEIEYLFINAVKIEYNYYVKKEQARQEQLAIREQMRQEAEERKALEAEKKKVEREESKYQSEITKLQESMNASTSDDETAKLQERILELQKQLADVVLKREEISNLQNGKAGNVYVISNLGSFGDDVFKIGMTRRLDPQDRINELGSASVPFRFDVHSFIFSDDAVALEKKLHDILKNKRLNKVNMRKEFFKVSIDELEALITDIEPTAEFNKTMIAEEFRQSLSTDDIYNSDFILSEDEFDD